MKYYLIMTALSTCGDTHIYPQSVRKQVFLSRANVGGDLRVMTSLNYADTMEGFKKKKETFRQTVADILPSTI